MGNKTTFFWSPATWPGLIAIYQVSTWLNSYKKYYRKSKLPYQLLDMLNHTPWLVGDTISASGDCSSWRYCYIPTKRSLAHMKMFKKSNRNIRVWLNVYSLYVNVISGGWWPPNPQLTWPTLWVVNVIIHGPKLWASTITMYTSRPDGGWQLVPWAVGS